MKRKRLLIAGVFATVAGYLGSYLTWKRRAIADLQTGSSVIETALGPVEYCMRGEGPAILVAHGSPGGYDQGSAFSKLVGGQHTFIAVSRPGYLRTPLTMGETPVAQADMYVALLDALAIEQATIVGISGGGPSAIQFALRYPTRCSSLVMISGVAQRYAEWELKQALSFPVRLFKQLYEKIITFDPLLYLLLPFAKLLPDAFATADFLCSVTQYDLRKTGYENDMKQFAAISDYPLEQITAPTFVVHAKGDREVPFSHAKVLSDKVPNVKLLTIAGGSHMAFYTHAAIVMPELRTFLRSM
ncbi:MAG TPA: alpha/beta hydrolase [Ktedonobacteraceae bacterium]|nr:alpha/beta hydrolase [Ktedonobacteraceae bacterium]